MLFFISSFEVPFFMTVTIVYLCQNVILIAYSLICVVGIKSTSKSKSKSKQLRVKWKSRII